MEILQICKECGVEFYVGRYRVNAGRGIFCTRSCSSADKMTQLRKKYAFGQCKDKKKQVRANGLINMRVRRGSMQKPIFCEVCKQKKKLDAHHPDYDLPDQVIWLCRSCHMKKHFEISITG